MLRTVDRILLGAPLLMVVCFVTTESSGEIITEPPSIHTNQDDVPPALRHWIDEKKPHEPSTTPRGDGDGEDPPPTAHTNQDRGDGGEDFPEPPRRDKRELPPIFWASDYPLAGGPKAPAAAGGDLGWPDFLSVPSPDRAVFEKYVWLADAQSWPDIDLSRKLDLDRGDRNVASAPSRPGTIPGPGAAVILGLGTMSLLSGRRRRIAAST
jgi:hypothetical protein